MRNILDRAYARTKQILTDNLDKLHVMSEALLQYETIDASQIDDVMNGKTPGPPLDWSKSGKTANVKDAGSGPSATGAVGGPAAQT